MEIKQITKVGKITQPFAVKSSMDTYLYKQNCLLTKTIGEPFAQKRKVAQVEPFKVFDEDQPLDLTVKKKMVVVENTRILEAKLYSETKEDLLNCKLFF